MLVVTVQKSKRMRFSRQTIANQQFHTRYSYDEHDRMTSKTYPYLHFRRTVPIEFFLDSRKVLYLLPF